MRVLSTVALLLVAIAPAAAEDLYNKDGVQLWTSARLITRDAATCHVLEDRHSDAEYERLKSNEGQPLHVWRLDLTAANYSGKVIEYLSASVHTESEWPPCTNWDWDVLQDYRGGVDWAGGILSLSQVADMPAGEEVRETMFLLVFEGQEPGFGRWTIDYNFADAASAPADRSAPAARPPSTPRSRPSAAPPSRSAAADQPPLIDHMRRNASREPPAAPERPSPSAGRDVSRPASLGRYGSGDGGDSCWEFSYGLRVGGWVLRRRGTGAPGDDSAAVRGGQVRGDVRGVGRLRVGRRLRSSSG